MKIAIQNPEIQRRIEVEMPEVPRVGDIIAAQVSSAIPPKTMVVMAVFHKFIADPASGELMFDGIEVIAQSNPHKHGIIMPN